MSGKENDPGINTKLVHLGERPDPATGSVVPPIYQTTTFAFPTNESMLDLMEGRASAYIYTRHGNPNQTMVEEKLAFLEEAQSCLVLASGMAAVSTAILTLLKAGDHILTHPDIYGGSFGLFLDVLPRFGIETTFTGLGDLSRLEEQTRKDTKVIFLETPSNPVLSIVDIRNIAGFARRHGLKVVVDNTFATPYNQKPLQLGADVVIHSCTKYLNGHSDVMAGAICGDKDYIAQCVDTFRKLGGNLNAFDAWLLMRGLKTFGLRMERHNQNGQKVAEFLAAHPSVERVYYPGLPRHEGYALARSQMTGFGGMMGIELQGGVETVNRVINRVRLFTRAVSLGSVESLITQSVAAVHHGLPAEFRKLAGIADNLVRISVGIEDPADLIADLEQALGG